ncbi:MAG TPA: response regulator transcription factor [Limnobacter sp.]|nr:response regulator transcription factor [Limnobacter sp.]
MANDSSIFNTRVLVVDDHPAVRLALRLVLEREGHQVIEAKDGNQAMQEVRSSKPDLVIVDIGLPTLDGLNLIKRLRLIEPAPRIIVLSGKPADIYAPRSIAAGAVGFVHKQEDLSDLLDAVKIVLRGHTYFPASAMQIGRETSQSSLESSLIETLSNREITVLKRLAEGQRNQDIANALHLSCKTVSTYKTRLMQKLNLSSMVELTDFARRHGLG